MGKQEAEPSEKDGKALTPRCTRTGCSSRQSRDDDNESTTRGPVTSGTYRDRVLPGMPARVQDLLVEVQGIKRHVFPHAAWPSVLYAHLVARERTTNLLCFERRFIRLEDHVVQRVCVVYPEVVVI